MNPRHDRTMCSRPSRGLSSTRRALPVVAGLLAALATPPAAHAVTFVSIDGHPAPVTLTVGETVIVRCDVAKAGGALNGFISLDLAGDGKYDPKSPLWTIPVPFTDGGGGDQDATAGKIARPIFIAPTNATGRYILRLEDTSAPDGGAVELSGVTIVPKPEAQAISGRVALANPAGAVPTDALIWAYANASTPVASAKIKPDGSYALPVPPGTYLVFAEWFGSLHSQRQTVNLVAAQQRSGVDFSLIQGQEVSGTVRSSGQAAADAIVQAVLANGATVATKSFSDGSYTLALPRGQHQITAMGRTVPVVVTDGPVDGVDFPPAEAGPTPGPGTILTIAGNGISGYGGDGQLAVNARLTSPVAVVVDRAGNLYLGMGGVHRVRRIDGKSGMITTIAGSAPFEFVRGFVPGIGLGGYGGDGGPATRALLNNPQNLALDAAGNLYISDLFNHRIRTVDPNGMITTVVGTGKEGLSGDGGLNRILKMSPAGIVSLVAGTGTAGFSGDGGPATQAQFNTSFPKLVVDSAGNLFFVDRENNRVRKVSADGIMSTVAGSGPNFPEPGSYGGDGGPATAAQLWNPRDITIDAAGNVIFAELSNNRIRKVIGIAAPGLFPGP